uniref:Uncharacterized protein n=1 Tax=Astatotilapia calliptera TaxID=8154 RepID=A0A3P8N8L9_ASTCA
MPTRMDDVMRLCCEVSAHEEIKVAVKNSTKGAMVAGGSAFVGGLLGGPPGIAVGGVIGGLSSWLTSKKFKSVPEILGEMTDDQRRELFNAIRRHLRGLVWKTAEDLIDKVMRNPDLKTTIINLLIGMLM